MTLSLFWRVLFWGWTASEIVLQAVTRTRRSGGELRDRGSLGILLLTIALSITVGTTFGGKHPHTFANGVPWFRPACAFLMVAGLALRWTAIAALGKAFSVNVAIRTDQRVQKAGLYRLIRHPSYTGLVLILLSIGLATRNWIALAIVFLPSVAALLYRIQVEEAALCDAFGPEYRDYQASTKRLLPGIF